MNPAMLKSKRGQTLKSEQVVENVVLLSGMSRQ
jgi:hypothetical protein